MEGLEAFGPVETFRGIHGFDGDLVESSELKNKAGAKGDQGCVGE